MATTTPWPGSQGAGLSLMVLGNTADPSPAGHEDTERRIPLWMYSLIGLLSVGLLLTCLAICIYLHLRRKWRRAREQKSQQSARDPRARLAGAAPPRIFAGTGEESGKKPKSEELPADQSAVQVTAAGQTKGSTGKSAGTSKTSNNGEGKKRRSSLRHALSRLSAPDVVSGGSSDSRSFKIDHQTVSYGSRFHVAQSPDASVHFRIGCRRGSIPQYPSLPKQSGASGSMTGNWSTDGSGENESEEITPPSDQPPENAIDSGNAESSALYQLPSVEPAAARPLSHSGYQSSGAAATAAAVSAHRAMSAHEQVMMPFSLSNASRHRRKPSSSSNVTSWSHVMAQADLPQPIIGGAMHSRDREVPVPVLDEAAFAPGMRPRSTLYRPQVTSMPVTFMTSGGSGGGAAGSRVETLQQEHGSRSGAMSISPQTVIYKRTSRSSSLCQQDQGYRYEIDVDRQPVSGDTVRYSIPQRDHRASVSGGSRVAEVSLPASAGLHSAAQTDIQHAGRHVQRSASQRSATSKSRLQRSSRYTSDEAVNQLGRLAAQPPWEADLSVGDRHSRDSGLMATYPDWAFTLARKQAGGASGGQRRATSMVGPSTAARGGSGMESGRQSKASFSRTLPLATPTPESILNAPTVFSAILSPQSHTSHTRRDQAQGVKSPLQPSILHV